MKKRLTAFVLIIILVVTGISGCDNEEKDSSSKQADQQILCEQMAGRYMEENVTLPELSSQETIILIVENPKGQIEAYSRTPGQYLCYILKEDGTWESSIPGWLNDGTVGGNAMLNNLFFHSNGTYYAAYAIYGEDSIKSKIIMSDDGGKTAGEVDIPYLKEQDFWIENIAVTENGDFVLSAKYNKDYLFIFSGSGEKLNEVTGLQKQSFMVSGNNIIAMDENGSQLIFYNTVKEETEQSIDYALPKKSASIAINIKEDGTILLGDPSGINRLSKDGTLWETTVDGTLNCMSIPELSFVALFTADRTPEEYYAVYRTNEKIYQLKHYVFNKNVSAIPEHEITVYSLTENRTVRQAISMYQSENTNVKVNYVVAVGENFINIHDMNVKVLEDNNVSDHIRVLNTELLNGNGADVLILDGLPAESYMEKGVLGDISDVILPLIESGELLSNITENYKEDDKIYRLPLRFSVPIVIGKQDAVSSVSGLENIMDLIRQSDNKPFTVPQSYDNLLSDYLALYSDDLFQEGKLVEENYAAFLEDIKKVADNIGAGENLESYFYDTESGVVMPDTPNILFGNHIDSFLNYKNIGTVMVQMKHITDTALLYAEINEFELDFSTINDAFLPSGMVSLNQASKESDIAKDFIRFLFSVPIQTGNMYDGFPVNSISLKIWTDKENETYSGIVSDSERTTVLNVNWPGKEEREHFYQIACSVKAPIETNYILNNMIIEQSLPFFLGQADAKQTASNVKTKVNTYLSE